MRDIQFNPELFRNYMSGTVLDELLCSYKGLPKGVNYMIIGDPGVGKTTIILDLLSNICSQNPDVRVLFISAEMKLRSALSGRILRIWSRHSGFSHELGLYTFASSSTFPFSPGLPSTDLPIVTCER